MMRMSHADFQRILSYIEQDITPKRVLGGNKVISPKERLALTISHTQNCFALLPYNAYYNLGLREINSLITNNSNSYNLRKSLNVVLNRPKTELGRRSFVHRSAIAWNALPDNLKDSSNLSTFKYNLKQFKQTIMNINFGKGGNVIHKTKPDFHYY